MTIDPRYQFAIDVVGRCGNFLLSHEEMREDVRAKKENDYVTVADRTVEKMLMDAIAERFPSDSFFAEESGNRGCGGDRWIIDPIDGTVNFMTGFPCYTISVAFERDGRLLFGIVSVPRQNLLFRAYEGDGAFLNDRRLVPGTDHALGRGLVLLVPPHRRHPELDGYLEVERKFYDVFSDVRSIGSAAFSLCCVAAGWCQAYYERFLNLYDVAAGVIIARQAGGKASWIENADGSLDILAGSEAGYEASRGLLDGKF